MTFRYMDQPTVLTSGEVQRYPLVVTPYTTYGPLEQIREARRRWLEGVAGRIGYTLRLTKRRARCGLCDHRHGPTRNLVAEECRAVDCHCTLMTDWPAPAELLRPTTV